ncbi:MAG: NAD-dependent epimerase/dehydratase family protein [Vicinamibacterales bacterium]|nr:NAD-dependent epimerase/dehydratase family protein [Vicinamibacterales bacterium]
MSRYFVTGATGFVGGELVKQLLGRGHDVVALVRAPARATFLKALGVEMHTGDITDRASLRRPMEGVDGVFHVAAWYQVGVRNPDAERINVEGTRHVLDVMRELGIPKGVYTSTVAVFGNTRGRVVDETYRFAGPFDSEYGRTKWKAHYEVAVPAIEAGLPLVIVQPGVVYGPGDTSGIRQLWVQHLRGRLPAVPGRTAYCWGHIEDTARGHILAMERGQAGESYILTGPAHTMRDAVRTAARISGRRPPLLSIPPIVFRALSPVMGLVERVTEVPASMTAEGLRVLAGSTYLASPAKAHQALGFETRSLEEGLRHTIEHELRQLGRTAT